MWLIFLQQVIKCHSSVIGWIKSPKDNVSMKIQMRWEANDKALKKKFCFKTDIAVTGWNCLFWGSSNQFLQYLIGFRKFENDT